MMRESFCPTFSDLGTISVHVSGALPVKFKLAGTFVGVVVIDTYHSSILVWELRNRQLAAVLAHTPL